MICRSKHCSPESRGFAAINAKRFPPHRKKKPGPDEESEPGKLARLDLATASDPSWLTGPRNKGDPDELVAVRLDSPPTVARQYHLVGLYSHIPQDHLLSWLNFLFRSVSHPTTSQGNCPVVLRFARPNVSMIAVLRFPSRPVLPI